MNDQNHSKYMNPEASWFRQLLHSQHSKQNDNHSHMTTTNPQGIVLGLDKIARRK